MKPLPSPSEAVGPSKEALSALSVRYEFLGEVGRGAMGVVFRARHKTLDRPVAIKVTLPGAPIDRFLREARLLAQISSPHVVAVHDCDVLPDGHPVLVMEWIEGSNLHDLIEGKRGPLSEAEVLPWMRDTAHGMLMAAEQGIIHRDLKPSNILIDHFGRARVADFGLARGPERAGELMLTFARIMGTPYYMAPEQAEDPRGVDTRADVYSFGATFYHALTGEVPFDGETAFSILFKHKTEPLTPPKARNPKLSQRMNEIIERCLAKTPGDRFQTFAEVGRQLEPSPGSPWDASEDRELERYLAWYHTRRDVYLHRRAELTEPDAYEFPRGRTLRVLCSDIVTQQVDAIVSSEDEDLMMGGGVSQAIKNAAGPGYVEQAKRFVPVRLGRAVVTSAGALPARFVFHGITLGFSRHARVCPSRDLISEIMASCFYHADTLSVETIAFPLLGTGAGGFSEAVCLDMMFRFLARMLLHGLTSVREARIVLFQPRA
jgi:eukaryotic-like serine/threonine-protein kinase